MNFFTIFLLELQMYLEDKQGFDFDEVNDIITGLFGDFMNEIEVKAVDKSIVLANM